MQELDDCLQASLYDDKDVLNRGSNASPKNKKWGKSERLWDRVKEDFKIFNEHVNRVDEAVASLQK